MKNTNVFDLVQLTTSWVWLRRVRQLAQGSDHVEIATRHGDGRERGTVGKTCDFPCGSGWRVAFRSGHGLPAQVGYARNVCQTPQIDPTKPGYYGRVKRAQ